MFKIVLETPTCDPACTHENNCSGTTCMCGAGAACTGDQTCTNGTCGTYLYYVIKLSFRKTSKIQFDAI